MAAPRFLVAKYVDDLRRMEPKNIGVILWSEGHVASRFIGDTGDPLQASAPMFIAKKNRGVYREWVQHWRRQIHHASLPNKKGALVDKLSEDYLDALKLTARENYVLADGGFLLDHLAVGDLPEAVNQLFDQLVGDPPSEPDSQSYKLVRRGWKRILTDTGLRRRSDFHERYPLQCQIEGVSRRLEFDNAIGNGTPDALFHRVLLPRDESVNSAFLMLETVTEHKILPKQKCAAIVYASPQDKQSEAIVSAMQMLEHHATVINVCDVSEAMDAIDAMGLPLSGTH